MKKIGQAKTRNTTTNIEIREKCNFFELDAHRLEPCMSLQNVFLDLCGRCNIFISLTVTRNQHDKMVHQT